MDAQMKKGILEMCILHLISKSPLYGYEIMKKVKEAFPDVYDGSIYAVLRRLNADGCTETYLGEVSGGPPRKYYRLTPPGNDKLFEALDEWNAVLTAIKMLGIADKRPL